MAIRALAGAWARPCARISLCFVCSGNWGGSQPAALLRLHQHRGAAGDCRDRVSYAHAVKRGAPRVAHPARGCGRRCAGRVVSATRAPSPLAMAGIAGCCQQWLGRGRLRPGSHCRAMRCCGCVRHVTLAMLDCCHTCVTVVRRVRHWVWLDACYPFLRLPFPTPLHLLAFTTPRSVAFISPSTLLPSP